jgi:serine/threonine-protein kinase
MPDTVHRLADALGGRYTRDGEIGAGGMAVVYGAEDLKPRRWVGIRVLCPELAATIGADWFLREIEIAARLSRRRAAHVVVVVNWMMELQRKLGRQR